MTTLQTIIHEVKAHQGTIFVVGDKIHLRAPAPLPPRLIDDIREKKPALLLYLPQVAAGAGIPDEWAALPVTAIMFATREEFEETCRWLEENV